ncbi:MAG: ABC transporter substrate-binding protein [Nitrososphaerales archaeon]
MLIAVGVIVIVASASLYYLTLPPPPPGKVSIGIFSLGAITTLTNSAVWLADDLGFYEEEGLEVEVMGMASTPTILQAMAGGEIDLGAVGAQQAFQLAATGDFPNKVFLGMNGHGAEGVSLIVARKDIATIHDLKGKNFAISRPGDPMQLISIQVLRAMGFDNPEGNINWVGVGSPAARAAGLASGELSAIATSLMTWVTIQDDPNLHILVDTDEISKVLPPQVGAVMASTKFIEDNPEIIKAFTRAHIRAYRYFAENKDAWINACLERRPDMTYAQLSTIYDKLTWAVNGGLNPDDWNEAVNYYYGLPEFEGVPRIGMNDWVTTSFVDEVLRDLKLISGADDPGRAIQGLFGEIPMVKEEDQ